MRATNSLSLFRRMAREQERLIVLVTSLKREEPKELRVKMAEAARVR